MSDSNQTIRSPFEEEAQQFIQRSDEYWVQALEMLETGHLEKASELAWGSVIERVKALALAKHRLSLRGHRDVRDYVKRVAISAADEALYQTFKRAESLHVNFYESFFDRF